MSRPLSGIQSIAEPLTFWELFVRVLRHKPLQALAAGYWHLTRRRVRARNRLRVASADLPFAYAVWIGQNENERALAEIAPSLIQSWAMPPEFAVALLDPGRATAREMQRSRQSVDSQMYRRWHWLAEANDCSDTAAQTGDYLIVMRAGDSLSPTALFRIAQALQTSPDAAVLYGDQDQLDERGNRSNPWFKPRWNREMFLANDFLSGAIAIDMRLAGQTPMTASRLADLLLEFAFTDRSIIHVPHVLCHISRPSEPADHRLPAVSAKIESLGASCSRGPFDTLKITWPLPENLPLVTIIVPTKDKVELLRPCVDSVLQHTEYDQFEILIVDNGSVEKRTADYLAAVVDNSKVRCLPYPGKYNFSAINNAAVHHARGSYLCLLNNDTEVVGPGWLTEMMRYAVREEVGAVGAKLLYADKTVQHAGVVVGIGDAAGHAHRFLPDGAPGYFRQPHVTQYVSAVTAACMVVSKAKYELVGGLDELELAVAFNDVDFCLKLEKAGWRNVYVPHAVLMHHESKSRGLDVSPLNIDRYRRELRTLQDRWATRTYQDPLHNPNLDRYSETYVFSL